MTQRSSTYWQGEPLNSLSRERLERAAEQAISELVGVAERERQRAQRDLVTFAFLAGLALASAGALAGLLIRG